MTPDEIVTKFLVALDKFEPITDQPSDSDLTRLREAIAPLLLQIPYDDTGGVHNLIGIVRAKPAYLKRYGEAFPEPTRVGAYNLEIDDDATAVVSDSLCYSRASVHTAVCLPYVRGLEPVYVRRYACHTYMD